MNKDDKSCLQSYQNCSVFISLQWICPKPSSNQKQTEKIEKTLHDGMHHCHFTHDVPQFTAADPNSVSERHYRRLFCQVYNATVCLISHLSHRVNGNRDRNLHSSKTIICCASWSKTLPSSSWQWNTAWEEMYIIRIQLLSQSIHSEDKNTNIHKIPSLTCTNYLDLMEITFWKTTKNGVDFLWLEFAWGV